MNALLQLMALPAACMLFAWARHGGATGLVRAVYRVVATAATGIGRMALASCAGRKPVPKTHRPQRASAIPGAFHRALKAGRIPHIQPFARTAGRARGCDVPVRAGRSA